MDLVGRHYGQNVAKLLQVQSAPSAGCLARAGAAAEGRWQRRVRRTVLSGGQAPRRRGILQGHTHPTHLPRAFILLSTFL